ncbi:unnamed protein product, partial [Ixodes pacificus]
LAAPVVVCHRARLFHTFVCVTAAVKSLCDLIRGLAGDFSPCRTDLSRGNAKRVNNSARKNGNGGTPIFKNETLCNNGQSETTKSAPSSAIPPSQDVILTQESGCSTSCDRVEGGTVIAHLQTSYMEPDEARAIADQVAEGRKKLTTTAATERKFSLTSKHDEVSVTPENASRYVVTDVDTISSMLATASVCSQCKEAGLTIKTSTEHGLAVKFIVSCSACGESNAFWSSPRLESSKAFDVNIRAMQAIKGIGKGQTALNDFFATLNVSHRGLHQKTYQEHLKKYFLQAAKAMSATICAEAATIVKDVYKELDPTFTGNIT